MDISILGFSVTLNDDPQLDGVCFSIFFCGCVHKCDGCHNPQSWNKENGFLMSLEDMKEKIRNSSVLIKSVCFCGGEPLLYKSVIKELVNYCKNLNLKIILYTGYLFEEIEGDIIKDIDIIIDGKFMKDKIQNCFPASSNQRVFINGLQINPDDLKINQK